MNAIKHTWLGLTTVLVMGQVGCSGDDFTIDIAPFVALAKSADCADTANRLFVISDEFVFWDKRGACSDASYAFTLFGDTVDQPLCMVYDSIAGPQGSCEPEYQGMFDTITSHVDEPDLGLGEGHVVVKVRV